MTKINNDSVSQCLLHCLKQRESKYGEALVHSDGLSKHGVLLMWKTTKIRKLCPFFFSQNFCITLFINSLPPHITVESSVYSQPDFVMCLVVTALDLSFLHPHPPPPQSKNIRIGVLIYNDMN